MDTNKSIACAIVATLSLFFSYSAFAFHFTYHSHYAPTLTQQPKAQAKIELKHGSCGYHCRHHEITKQAHQSTLSFTLGMQCPQGTTLNYLAYREHGGTLHPLITHSTGKEQYSQTLSIAAFTRHDIQQRCEASLGGEWVSPDRLHHPKASSSTCTLSKAIDVFARCSNSPFTVMRTYPAKQTLVCLDQGVSFPAKKQT